MNHSMLPFFGVIRVSGEDRVSFLHGQLSNHIEAMQAQQAGYATYNTPKGRVIANMIVFNRGDDILLILAQNLLDIVIKRLRMFVLRAKVSLEAATHLAVAGELADGIQPSVAQTPQYVFSAQSTQGVAKITLPHGGTLLIGETEQLPPYQAENEQAWQLHEIRSAYPWISANNKEMAVAQMMNQHIIGGVHFRKGCYPGQEIIARAQYRGQVKRGLALLNSPQIPVAGTILYEQETEVGFIINSVAHQQMGLSLAVIKHSATHAQLHDEHSQHYTVQQCFFELD